MTQRQIDNYKLLLLIVGVVALVSFAYALREVYASITIALVLFYLLDPIVIWCTNRRFGRHSMPRLLAVVIAIIVATGIIALFLVILIPPIADQVQRFSDNMPAYMKQFENIVQTAQQRYNRLEIPPEVDVAVNRGLENVTSELIGMLRKAASNTSNFFSQIMLLFMIPFLTFYMLLEKSAVADAIVKVWPKKNQEEFRAVLSESSGALRGYIVGQLTLSLIMGVAITLILRSMGVKAPLLLGLIAGVTKMIPVIGIFLGCIPAAFVALSDSLSLALWVVAIFTALQLLENKIILPVLLSRYVNLSPLTILLALIVGEQLGGILGMFVAPPVAAVLHVFYIHIRRRYD